MENFKDLELIFTKEDGEILKKGIVAIDAKIFSEIVRKKMNE